MIGKIQKVLNLKTNKAQWFAEEIEGDIIMYCEYLRDKVGQATYEGVGVLLKKCRDDVKFKEKLEGCRSLDKKRNIYYYLDDYPINAYVVFNRFYTVGEMIEGVDIHDPHQYMCEVANMMWEFMNRGRTLPTDERDILVTLIYTNMKLFKEAAERLGGGDVWRKDQ